MTQYAILHPDGYISVRIDGHPFFNKLAAEDEMWEFEQRECDWCGKTEGHRIVERTVGEWT